MEGAPVNTGQTRQETPPFRLSAIDIGTNSFRCIVVEVDSGGRFKVLDDEKATVRLGEGLAATGLISATARTRAIETLQRMAKISAALNADIAAVVATSAVRKARNRNRFLQDVKRETGLDVEVISGEREAGFACLSAYHNFAMENQRYVIADIGGGSVEIVVATGRQAESVTSLDLGAVFLTETFIRHDPVSFSDLKRLRRHIRKILKKHDRDDVPPVGSLIGSGGTMTNIGSMVMAMRAEQYDSVHRYEVIRSEIVHLLALLARSDREQRLGTPGLNPERADIILAGMVLTDELMRHFRTNLLKINAQGIREGLILESLRQRGLGSPPTRERYWRDSVLDFGRSCRFDEPHSTQVNRLAQKIFASVASENALDNAHARLLEAGALLHDIGYFIAHERHHKHSYHLIRHANLFGFSPREREIVANIARYHRKAKPKKDHQNFSRLSPEDRTLVGKLGGIVRLADGLDRRRNGQVEDIECLLHGKSFHLKIFGRGDLSVERHGARSKCDLFESAFGYRLTITTATGHR